MIWVIIAGMILVLIFTFSLLAVVPRSSLDDETQWEEIQKWKEKKSNA